MELYTKDPEPVVSFWPWFLMLLSGMFLLFGLMFTNGCGGPQEVPLMQFSEASALVSHETDSDADLDYYIVLMEARVKISGISATLSFAFDTNTGRLMACIGAALMQKCDYLPIGQIQLDSDIEHTPIIEGE